MSPMNMTAAYCGYLPLTTEGSLAFAAIPDEERAVEHSTPASATASNVRPSYFNDDNLDTDACKSLYLAVIARAIHDACGAIVDGQHIPSTRVAVARSSWAWLHSATFKNDREIVCEFAGISCEAFAEAVDKGEIPYPERKTVLRSAAILEQVYWRMGGRIGPMPFNPEAVAPRTRSRGHTPPPSCFAPAFMGAVQ